MLCQRKPLVKNSKVTLRGKLNHYRFRPQNRHDLTGQVPQRASLVPVKAKPRLGTIQQSARLIHSPPPGGRPCSERVYMTVMTPEANKLQGIQSLVVISRFMRA